MKQRTNKYHEFWVSNISDKNVTLRDLAISIKARSHVNLLDSRHYSYTFEELKKSAESGSLFAKSKLLKVRDVPPPEPLKAGQYVSKEPLFMTKMPLFSQVVIEEPKFEELEISEVEIADQLADAFLDNEND